MYMQSALLKLDLTPLQRSQTSEARSPWRYATNTIVASRCPWRLTFLAVSADAEEAVR
jgi:hypothetical protein